MLLTMLMNQRPLALYKTISILSVVFLFISFFFFLLVSLSLTIIKPIYLFSLVSTAPTNRTLSLATEVRFGIWGFCTHNALGDPPLCEGPALGYNIPSYVAPDIGVPQAAINAVQQALLVILILHPITAAFSILPLFFSLFLASHPWSIFTLILSVIKALLATAALAIDLTIVLVARTELNTLSQVHLAFQFGPAFWMIVVATIFAWAAVVTLSARACYCLGVRRHPRDIPRRERRHQHEKEIDLGES